MKPCWKSSWSLVATRLATCDWREQDHPIHQSGVLACKTTNRHRAPGVRDEGNLVERVIIENKPHSSLQLLCGILRHAERRVVGRRFIHLRIPIRMAEAVEIQTPNIEAGMA